MRALLTNLLVVVILLWSHEASVAFAEETQPMASLSLNGVSAILIDAKTGQVLYEKNPDEPLYPASITKIATGIYAIENGNPDDIVTVSKNARYEDGTRVYLGEGEQVTLRKLEYGLLMHSGNDAATAIAEHMSGTREQFAAEMTRYIKEKTGVQHTNFTNPHGLHDDSHYTTASDMAKIARYAMQNPTFREIVATNRLPWDGAEWKSELINHNKLIRDYEGATGIKNGFTDQAMHTLVGSAKRGDTELIAVTMKAASSNMAYQDVAAMLDFGFENFETVQVTKAGEEFLRAADTQGEAPDRFVAKDDLFATVPIGTEPEVKVTARDELSITAGSLAITYPLERITPPKKASLSASGDGQAEQASAGDVPVSRYFLLVAWLALNVFLIALTIARARKQRRIRRRELQRKVW